MGFRVRLCLVFHRPPYTGWLVDDVRHRRVPVAIEVVEVVRKTGKVALCMGLEQKDEGRGSGHLVADNFASSVANGRPVFVGDASPCQNRK